MSTKQAQQSAQQQSLKPSQQHSGLDRFIMDVDQVVRTISVGSAKAHRSSPLNKLDTDQAESARLSAKEKKHIGGLMRINHTGEVCAQALYRGQALTAKSESVKAAMHESAKEEEDHLAWCEERLQQLGCKPSLLNPLFYGMSLGVGAIAGAAGDKWSLGFVAATEDQVCKHLREHLEQLPDHDTRSRAILEQMISDEEHHGEKARNYGGVEFNRPTKKLMTAVSKVMTATTYRI